MTVNSQKNHCTIQASEAGLVRLVQITDCHIFADPAGCLLGLNTRESFEAVCSRMQKEEWAADALLATGDLAQDASPEAYQYLAEQLGQMKQPTFWLPGNHDDPQTMACHFNNHSVLPAKQIFIGNWQIILLDSSVKEEVWGHLSQQELNFLETALKQYPEKHALISLHHQPVDVDCIWIDQIGLKNRQQFKQLIEKHKQVKCVLWGHVHQRFHEKHKGIDWIATPSSCVQFKPRSQEFSAGDEAPGYRYLYLYSNGCVETVLHRIDTLEYTVDYAIKGY